MLWKTITADNALEFADISDLEYEIPSILQGPIQLGNEALTKDVTVYFVTLFRKENEWKVFQNIHYAALFIGVITYHLRYYITKHHKKSF